MTGQSKQAATGLRFASGEADLSAFINDAAPHYQAVVKARALPLNWQVESDFAKRIVMASRQLKEAEYHSIVEAVTNAANVGLSFNPIRKHVTMVPRYNRKLECYEASLMVMYQGLMFLATQAGVTDIVAEVVYEKDKFEIERTDQGDKFSHKLSMAARETDDNKFLGAYVAARMPGSRLIKVEWVPALDIYKMRDNSDSYLGQDGKPNPNAGWVVWFDEYAKKSAIKRASKRWEEAAMANTSEWSAFKTAVDIDNASEGVIKPRDTDIEGKAEPVLITEEQSSALLTRCAELKMNPEKIFRAYNISSFGEIRASLYEEVVKRIDNFEQQKKSKADKQSQ
jgi:recombinational DNA repair protein RecT